MAGRLDRFRNLEGARPKQADEQPLGELQERRQAQLASGLALDPNPDDAQPFVRCGQCGTDSNRTSRICPTCASELDTPLQRAFNEAFWKQQHAARQLEGVRAHEPAALAVAEEGELARDQRALGELLALEVREREAKRLGWMSSGQTAPPGTRLLHSIADPARRGVVTASLVGFGALLAYQALFAAPPHPLLLIPLGALVGLFLPSRR